MKFTTSDVMNPVITNSSWPTRLQQSIPASFTIWYDPVGAVYYGESNVAGVADIAANASAHTVVNAAFAALTGSRAWKEKVLLKGNFSFTDTIQIPSYTVLEIQGKISLANGSNDEVIENANQDGTGNSYIDIIGGEINGNAVGQSFGAGYVGAGVKFANVSYSSIRDVYIHDCYNAGIYWYSGGFDIVQGYNVLDHCTVNTTSATGAGVALGCATLGRWARGWVTDCIFRNATDFGGLTLDEGTDCHIIDNVIRDNTKAGLIIEGTNASYKNANHEVRGNWIYGQLGTAGYGLNVIEDLNGIIIEGNHVMANARTGIRIEGSDYCVINGNLVKNNNQAATGGSGILLMDSTGACLHNTITNNICIDDQGTPTQEYGIRELNNANFNVIMGNICYNNTAGQIAVLGANTLYRTATHSDPLNLAV